MSSMPLSKRAVQILEALPGNRTGRVFSSSMDALQSAWKGVREKAGLPNLRMHDLRHVAATDYARAGMNSHQLQRVLAHKTTTQAQIYVNLVNSDILQAMDGMADKVAPVPPVTEDRAAAVNANKARRLNGAPRHMATPVPVPADAASVSSGNVVQFPDRFNRAPASPPAPIDATGTQ